ncbi:DNA-binding response regulator, OmpR family, contains REC and winged-helix (wHTH) domain [Acetoanaerobium noterae]|uniref:Stage 0 sporulation protein A homolog n=1 Tax=Acetoanaerobium noterae TaxID=745369 RepID=A0A1T5APD2_9FIRM|nr:response regulator transcription factor [Acetoanaerobium noterae]SKB36463.1 DNA-binding response regulator, OmpR family, contains REC and winged-helix (wHTH) domain [Acetoanaerobium noterae]
MEKNINILICDDNPAIHDTIGAYLKLEGMEYFSAFDGIEALEIFKKEQPDFVILDIMMPKMFGTQVCKEIRKISDVPILMLTAKGEEIDRIVGLEIGADDYVIKPFSPREVVTRVKAILRRYQSDSKKIEENKKIIKVDNLIVDLDKYLIEVDKCKIEATPKEIEILYLLVSNIGKVYTREQILSSIWGYDYFGDTRAVDTHIKRLRKKLPEIGTRWEIKSIYGVGYKFEVQNE